MGGAVEGVDEGADDGIGWIDRTRVIDESLTGIFRAGADSVLTYWALEVARRAR